jgi:hypothetical protein
MFPHVMFPHVMFPHVIARLDAASRWSQAVTFANILALGDVPRLDKLVAEGVGIKVRRDQRARPRMTPLAFWPRTDC